MVGVAENDLGLDVVQVLRCHGFDRAVGADGHEYGGFDAAVVEFDGGAAGVAVFFVQGEFKHDGFVFYTDCLSERADYRGFCFFRRPFVPVWVESGKGRLKTFMVRLCFAPTISFRPICFLASAIHGNSVISLSSKVLPIFRVPMAQPPCLRHEVGCDAYV